MYSQLKRSTPFLAALLALAGCGDSPSEPDATATPTDNATAAMGKMEPGATPVQARSSGTITALDQEAGKVTLNHEAIPEAEWPAMTMGFDADPALLGDLEVGDRVAFDVEIAGSSGKVTAISKE